MKLMKPISIAVALCLSAPLFASDVISLQDKIESMGDDKIYVKEKDCDSHNHNCNTIPYDYDTVWFWLSDEEKETRTARNIANRNKWLAKKSPERDEWLKENDIVLSKSEVDAAAIRKQKAALARSIAEHKKKSEQVGSSFEKTQEKLNKLKGKYESLKERKSKLSSKALGILQSNPEISGGESGVLEDFESTLKGQGTLKYNKANKADLKKLGGVQRDIRDVIREMQNLNEEISDTSLEGKAAQNELLKLQNELASSQGDLEKKTKAYGKAFEKIKGEKEQQSAYLKSLALKDAKNAAEKSASLRMKELEDGSDFAEFLMRDYASLQKDLKIDELEANNLLNKVDNRIKDSVLGHYIQEQMEKTLAAALGAACQSAKACSEHKSIDGSMRSLEKEIEKATEKLRESKDIHK